MFFSENRRKSVNCQDKSLQDYCGKNKKKQGAGFMSVYNNKNNDLNPMYENLNKIPGLLYKYRSFDSCGHSLQLASNGEVYFASAKDFNDPLDNYFIPNSEVANYKGKKLDYHLREKALKYFPDVSKNELEKKIKIMKKRQNMMKSNDPQIIDEVMKIQYNSFGICSLSSNPKSLPTWAYYADSHMGMCIGLKASEIASHQRELCHRERLMMLHEVDYTNNIPNVCVDNEPDAKHQSLKEIEATLFTKSNCWKHEKEYRLIFKDYVSKSYIFGTRAVGEILIGYKASDKKIELLLKQLNSANSDAVVKRAIRPKDKYTMEFEVINS